MAAAETLAAVKRIAAHLLGMGQTRLELAGVELAQARQSTIRIIVFSLLAAQVLLVASIFVAVALISLAWPYAPTLALLLAAVFYALAGWWAWQNVKQIVADEPPLFEATLGELKRDKAAVDASLRTQVNNGGVSDV